MNGHPTSFFFPSPPLIPTPPYPYFSVDDDDDRRTLHIYTARSHTGCALPFVCARYFAIPLSRFHVIDLLVLFDWACTI